ncbi:4-hydroxybenzoate octaprenyltransferase [Candidatus Methylopumilus turicensis]|uniref:4-hydroxybenzoate octaprenyltransferase n=1 Tax=Candidatus Methylopumilus turicensis TaxID=1581680 RepID=A0A0B7IVK0_9PROT|nr:p-hydroxybenzoate octaprenyltransferase [Candidatus Methylopumilus turicensis]
MNKITLSNKINAYERLMRLDKPIGILLLLWPTLWALWLAADGHPHWIFVGIFTLGTILMRSAGCVMNDVADRNFDGHVARTNQRPLISGEVGVKEALVIAVILSLIAFGFVLVLNRLTILLSIPALFLAASYPLTKRFFALPQAYLGVAFGFGIPMAFSAIQGLVPVEAWLMLLANICWSLAYDTEYAMVDRSDDLKIGIRSSAITFGRFDVVFIMFFYLTMLALMACVGHCLSLAWPYYVGLAAALGVALYHYQLIKNREESKCFKAFLHNNWIGALIFAGILMNYYL